MSSNYALYIDKTAVRIPAFNLHAGLLGEEVYFEDSRGRKTIGPLTSVKVFLMEGTEASREKTAAQLTIGERSLWLKPNDEITFLRMTEPEQYGAQPQ